MSNEHPLRRYRAERGLTLEQLAEQAGTTGATISRIENRSLRAGHDLLIRLANTTGLAIDDLVRASVGEAA